MTDVRQLSSLCDELGVRSGGTLLVHASLGGTGLRDTE